MLGLSGDGFLFGFRGISSRWNKLHLSKLADSEKWGNQERMQDFRKNSKLFLDLREASAASNISSWTLRSDIRNRKLAVIRRGGRRGKILIAVSDLDAYLQRCRIAALDDKRDPGRPVTLVAVSDLRLPPSHE